MYTCKAEVGTEKHYEKKLEKSRVVLNQSQPSAGKGGGSIRPREKLLLRRIWAR